MPNDTKLNRNMDVVIMNPMINVEIDSHDRRQNYDKKGTKTTYVSILSNIVYTFWILIYQKIN